MRDVDEIDSEPFEMKRAMSQKGVNSKYNPLSVCTSEVSKAGEQYSEAMSEIESCEIGWKLSEPRESVEKV